MQDAQKYVLGDQGSQSGVIDGTVLHCMCPVPAPLSTQGSA